MESLDKQVNTPAQSWTGRVERRHPVTVEYFCELRSWLNRAIVEAEKDKDWSKKDQLLALLKDL
jgi:hypothetical protein